MPEPPGPRGLAPIAWALTLWFTAWSVAGLAAQTDRQTRRFALPPGRTLAVELTIGDVVIMGAERQDADVEVVRQAPSSGDLARVPLEVVESDGSIDIRVVQTDGGRDPALRSTVTVRLPRAAQVPRVRVAEGQIRLSGLAGSITAEIARGPIDATAIQGTVRLETGIGDVTVADARLSAGGLLRLRTFNGDVRLTLAERPSSARILALALNGTISSDLPLTIKDAWGPRWGEATIGAGDPLISIDVITGRIVIRSP